MKMLIYPKESYVIMGCLMAVHRELGCGFLEKVYQEALEREFAAAGVPFEREKRLKINYKGKPLEQEYIADFVCFNKIIIELKTVSVLAPIHKAQVLNYLKATGYELGILANFAMESLEYKRVCNSNNLLYQ